MDTEVLGNVDGKLLLLEHRTTTVLRELGIILTDLDEGIIDKRVEKTEKKRGRAFTTLERQTIANLLGGCRGHSKQK